MPTAILQQFNLIICKQLLLCTMAWRLTILRDAARALAHLHAQRPVLLHGDVAAPSE